jgi:hypothetical protein
MEKHTRNFRYLILLLALLALAGNGLYDYLRLRNWDKPFVVRLYLNNGDGRKVTDDYLATLTADDFSEIAGFLNSESKKYGFSNDAILVQLSANRVASLKQPPAEVNVLNNIFWSLSFRSWSALYLYRNEEKTPDVALFLSYFDPAVTRKLNYSVGLQGGRLGLINLFAEHSYRGSNNVVIAHEMLHTFGATDKYDQDNNPLFPMGYAEPSRVPTLPQERAEIMGGRIPLTSHLSVIPKSLAEVIVGRYTAVEIHWVK